MTIPDTRPLYRKFAVTRMDGQDQAGEKHAGCEYFVLDITHDPVAPAALRALADLYNEQRPLLADDLRDWANTLDDGESAP